MRVNDSTISTSSVGDWQPIDSGAVRRQPDHDFTAVIVAGVHRWGGDILDRFGCRLLLPVALMPLIEHGVRWLTRSGLDDVCVCANSDTRVIRAHLDCVEDSGCSVRYYEDAMPRGPAGCVRDAAIESAKDAIVVLEGSIIPSFDLHEMIETHRREDAAMTIAVTTRSLGVSGAADRPAGVYILSKSVVTEVGATGYQDLKEVLIPLLHKRGARIAVHPIAFESASRVLDAASYLQANMTAVSRTGSIVSRSRGFVREADAWVHETAKLDTSARIMGEVIIGPNVRVQAKAMIIGPTVVGSGCTIEQHAVVSRSVLWNNCTVGRGVIVDHSVLTDGAHAVGADLVRETVLCSRR